VFAQKQEMICTWLAVAQCVTDIPRTHFTLESVYHKKVHSVKLLWNNTSCEKRYTNTFELTCDNFGEIIYEILWAKKKVICQPSSFLFSSAAA